MTIREINIEHEVCVIIALFICQLLGIRATLTCVAYGRYKGYTVLVHVCLTFVERSRKATDFSFASCKYHAQFCKIHVIIAVKLRRILINSLILNQKF